MHAYRKLTFTSAIASALVKSFDQFDFGFQPSIDEKEIREMRSRRFLYDATQVILLGTPGVGENAL